MTPIEIYREIRAIVERRAAIVAAMMRSTMPEKIKIYDKTIEKMNGQISDLSQLLPEKARISPERYFRKRGEL